MDRIDQAISLLAGKRAWGRAVFAVAAEALEIGLQCRWVGIAHMTDSLDAAHFLARRTDGRNDELGAYDIAGTPCGELYSQEWNDNYCFIEAGASEKYPGSVFAGLGAEFYCGEAFCDIGGSVVGHVYVMDDKPRQDTPQSRAFFRLIVQRIGAGYNRWRTQKELDLREQRFRDFAESSSDWFWETDENHRFVYVSSESDAKRISTT